MSGWLRFFTTRGHGQPASPGSRPSAAPAVLQRPSLSRSPYLQATPLVPGKNGPWVPTQSQEQFVNHFWGGLGVPGFTAFSLSAPAGAHSHPAEPLARPDTPQTTARPRAVTGMRTVSRKCARLGGAHPLAPATERGGGAGGAFAHASGEPGVARSDFRLESPTEAAGGHDWS